MKIVFTIARLLLGLMFLVFGSNIFCNSSPWDRCRQDRRDSSLRCCLPRTISTPWAR